MYMKSGLTENILCKIVWSENKGKKNEDLKFYKKGCKLEMFCFLLQVFAELDDDTRRSALVQRTIEENEEMEVISL